MKLGLFVNNKWPVLPLYMASTSIINGLYFNKKMACTSMINGLYFSYKWPVLQNKWPSYFKINVLYVNLKWPVRQL